MILRTTFLPNPANTLESRWRNCRALVANSQPRPRYSDIEEVQIARMGSVHAGWTLFPLHLYPQGSSGCGTSYDAFFPLCRVDCLGGSREWSGLILKTWWS